MSNVILTPQSVKKGAFGRETLSTRQRIVASPDNRAKYQAIYQPLLPKGLAMCEFNSHYEDWAIAGYVTPTAHLKAIMGNKEEMYKQAYLVGVRVRKGQQDSKGYEGLKPSTIEPDLTPFNAFMSATPEKRLEMLKAAGLVK